MTDADLAWLAQQAYTARPTFVSGDVCATLTWGSPKEPVVAFKGTSPDSLGDWLRDLDCIPAHDADLGWCHAGFLSGAREALEWVRTASQGCPATVVGHSLGGALAALSGALLRCRGYPVRRLVTFGCPKVGFWGVRKALAGVPMARYVHGDDPVPAVPPFFEHHVEASLPLNSDRSVAPIGDHSIDLYRKALSHA